MNVLYYRWGPSNLLWGICYTSVKGDNINFDECVVLQVGQPSNLLWGICYTSVKGDNINFDECVVLQVGAV